MAAAGEHQGVKDVINDLWLLIRDYAKQETIDPLKQLGRFLGWGLGGAVALSLGLGFIALAILRALQTETGDALDGNWSFVPYLVSLIFTAIAAFISYRTIQRPYRTKETAS